VEISPANACMHFEKFDKEFAITNELTTHDTWTFDLIDERSKRLVETALDIWKWE